MKFIYAIVISVFCFACSSTSKISNTNLSFIYQPTSNFLNPSYKVFHDSNSKSYLHFKFDNSELLYMKQSNDEMQANFKIEITSYTSFESKEVLDTISKTYIINSKPSDESDIYHFIQFNNQAVSSYLMKVNLIDINRNSNSVTFIEINKGSESLPQYFQVRVANSEIPLFRNHITSKESVVIKHSNSTVNKLWVRYYNREFPLASPPHSSKGAQIFSYIADSVFQMETGKELLFSSPGIYHFQTDTLLRNGLTLFRHKNEFPNLTGPNQLLEPLRYLSTKQEYDQIINSADKRKAIDNYWLKIAGSKERARYLIKSYYNRVQNSNRFFTSYIEGWKTDRGLIYTVLGIPDGIYKNANAEFWTYNGSTYSPSVTYTFKKISNPFSNNDYVLVRKSEYEYEWYKSVETWRKGRIVNP